VFKVTTTAGRVLAVRCFTREVSDHQRRYAAISKELARLKLPYTVGFEYLPDGILVKGRMCPLLKMEWVQGEGLVPYVRQRLRQPAALRALATEFLDMSAPDWNATASPAATCSTATSSWSAANLG